MADRETSPQELTRIVVRPVGSPLPLGFFAFGVGTVLLAAVELQWIRSSETIPLICVLLGYVAPLEILAGIFSLLSRDTGAGTAMCIFGAGWVALSLSYLMVGLDAKTVTLGIFLTVDSLAILALAVSSVTVKPMLSIILFLSAARFLLAAAVQFGAGEKATLASGCVGILTGVFAAYGGLAFLLEDVKQRDVLPVFRRKTAKAALEGGLDEQLSRIRNEAGVRHQL